MVSARRGRAALFVAIRPPEYEGDEDIEYLDSASFASEVRDRRGKVMTVVIFFADWCEDCTRLDPLFARLSVR